MGCRVHAVPRRRGAFGVARIRLHVSDNILYIIIDDVLCGHVFALCCGVGLVMWARLMVYLIGWSISVNLQCIVERGGKVAF